jgi:hypothetical protein
MEKLSDLPDYGSFKMRIGVDGMAINFDTTGMIGTVDAVSSTES